METIAEFNDKRGFNARLTKDKIYLSSTGNEETFALRSVNGIGLYDDIKKYNREMEAFRADIKGKRVLAYIFIGGGILIFITGIAAGKDGIGIALVEGGGMAGVGAYMLNKLDNFKEPKMDSYFKFMLSGASREFKFDKSDENAAEVANFITKVEETLTAYNN